MPTLLHQRPHRVGPFSVGVEGVDAVETDVPNAGELDEPTAGPDSTTSATAGSVPARGPVVRVMRRVAAIALLVGLLAAVAFWFTGGRWFEVQTPSMGTAAPVGALVLTRPVDITDLHVGDVIAFHPSTEPATFTHRIVSITGSGPGTTVQTQGDINGASDPWNTDQAHLIGRAVVLAPGLGYVMRALPLLAVGGFVVWLVTRLWLPARWRYTARMIGGSALYLLAATRIRPYVGIIQLTTTTNDNGVTQMSVVSTGVLPIRVVATSGTAAPLDLGYGQTGVVNLTDPVGGRYDLATHLHLSPWQWVVAVAIWLIPFGWSMLVSRRRANADAGGGRVGDGRHAVAVTP